MVLGDASTLPLGWSPERLQLLKSRIAAAKKAVLAGEPLYPYHWSIRNDPWLCFDCGSRQHSSAVDAHHRGTVAAARFNRYNSRMAGDAVDLDNEPTATNSPSITRPRITSPRQEPMGLVAQGHLLSLPVHNGSPSISRGGHQSACMEEVSAKTQVRSKTTSNSAQGHRQDAATLEQIRLSSPSTVPTLIAADDFEEPASPAGASDQVDMLAQGHHGSLHREPFLQSISHASEGPTASPQLLSGTAPRYGMPGPGLVRHPTLPQPQDTSGMLLSMDCDISLLSFPEPSLQLVDDEPEDLDEPLVIDAHQPDGNARRLDHNVASKANGNVLPLGTGIGNRQLETPTESSLLQSQAQASLFNSPAAAPGPKNVFDFPGSDDDDEQPQSKVSGRKPELSLRGPTCYGKAPKAHKPISAVLFEILKTEPTGSPRSESLFGRPAFSLTATGSVEESDFPSSQRTPERGPSLPLGSQFSPGEDGSLNEIQRFLASEVGLESANGQFDMP